LTVKSRAWLVCATPLRGGLKNASVSDRPSSRAIRYPTLTEPSRSFGAGSARVQSTMPFGAGSPEATLCGKNLRFGGSKSAAPNSSSASAGPIKPRGTCDPAHATAPVANE
jgi:hypothetical protein